MHARYDEVIEAFAALRSADVSEARPGIVEALQRHDKALKEHLEVEEELVIPMLLGLRPEEFDFFSRSPIATLIRAYSG